MLIAVGEEIDEAPRRSRPVVLLVDDCADTRSLYAEYLDLAGFDVKEADDGLAAVAEAASTIPDVVVLDLGLPGVGGREAAARMKADPRTRAVPVIIVSGFERSLVEKGEEIPWDEYVGKPCVPEDLVRTISGLLAARDPKHS
jgi:CheY-like chemotaxis protein